MKTLDEKEQIYWIREDDSGRITAGLVEKAFSDHELALDC